MSRRVSSTTTLDNLKKEAKRWLKKLRANDEQARARLHRAWPNAPVAPGLRDVQHAIALEHGLAGWAALKNQVKNQALTTANRAELVDSFLEYACADPILCNGPAAHARRERAALRILKRYPEIARDSIHTAVVCGDLEEVERILAEHPDAASQPGGPQRRRHLSRHEKLWTPLLHLCYGRLPLAAAGDNAVAIARALLDHGANPNDYFEVGDGPHRYTALCGVAGEGEDDAPPHPQREALARLLLERGAEPYDIQLLYNTHFRGDILWILEPIFEYALKAGRQFDLTDPEWSMIDMGGYGHGARYLLEEAIANNNLKLAEWLLAHGASPNAAPAPHPKLSKHSLHEEALRRGFTEMADLLVRYGATPSPMLSDGVEAFVEACFRLDREEAKAMLAQHPEYLQSPVPMWAAASRDRADVVAFLLDLGMSIEIEDQSKQRPLHVAAAHDSRSVGMLLIERGAELEPVETNWDNTPLDHAAYANLSRMVEFLSGLSRDVFRVTWNGNIGRLRELLRAEPDLAKAVRDSGTLLMWLPDDEARALEAVELLLAHGADPSVKSKEGMTAADYAEKRGLYDVAEMLRFASSVPASESASVSDRLTLEQYEKVAEDLLVAYRTGEAGAMQSVWTHFGHRRTLEAMRRYVQLDLGKTPSGENEDVEISLEDAQVLVARAHGFGSWQALAEYMAAFPSGKVTIAAKPVRLFSTDVKGTKQTVAQAREWETVIEMMREKRISGLDAEGEMTDAVIERISRLDHVTSLNLNGSKQLTDAGLRFLERMPRLRHLDLSGTEITDRGLEVLRQLKELKTINLAWSGVTDAGMANLKFSDQLERVDLSGTQTGDGAIDTLTGKQKLRHFRSGNEVTDAGLALFHQFPVFKKWQGGEVSMALLSYEAEPNYLMPRGPFTDKGLANLVGLDGLFALNLDASQLAITAAGLERLVDLPNLGWLAFDATDDAMPYIAAMPRLRFLGCQDTVAGDDGFVALSRSQSLEYIWGRRCYNLRSRGFSALSTMPALRSLSVSCKNVDDEGLSALPLFPALRELMPMDVPDDGYRHVGRCEQLESLVLMYCRDTTDAATEHIAGLLRLKKYFASYTKITDRSMEILGRMISLETISFYGCPGVTNAGVVALAGLPRLRELHVSGPQITPECAPAFSANVRVEIGV